MKSFSRMLKGFGRNAEEQIQKALQRFLLIVFIFMKVVVNQCVDGVFPGTADVHDDEYHEV